MVVSLHITQFGKISGAVILQEFPILSGEEGSVWHCARLWAGVSHHRFGSFATAFLSFGDDSAVGEDVLIWVVLYLGLGSLMAVILVHVLKAWRWRFCLLSTCLHWRVPFPCIHLHNRNLLRINCLLNIYECISIGYLSLNALVNGVKRLMHRNHSQCLFLLLPSFQPLLL